MEKKEEALKEVPTINLKKLEPIKKSKAVKKITIAIKKSDQTEASKPAVIDVPKKEILTKITTTETSDHSDMI